MLYQVAILEKPSKKERDEGASERLVMGPVPQVAGNEQSAAVLAVTEHHEKLDGVNPDRMEVIVLPFGG